jgi:flagellum-specific ATP synthase
VLSMLARLVERVGRFSGGSITAFYTVLMEGDDQQDPIVDTVRSLLDGHIVLDRNLALRNHYPPISVLESLSRLMPSVCSSEHIDKVGALRMLVAAYAQAEDLVRIGAYQKGTDPVLDRALAALPEINRFLRQGPADRTSMPETLQQLFALPS